MSPGGAAVGSLRGLWVLVVPSCVCALLGVLPVSRGVPWGTSLAMAFLYYASRPRAAVYGSPGFAPPPGFWSGGFAPLCFWFPPFPRPFAPSVLSFLCFLSPLVKEVALNAARLLWVLSRNLPPEQPFFF